MNNTTVAIASALLLAVLITELSQRIWPDSRLALLLLSFLALLVNGLFNARQSARAQTASSTPPATAGTEPRPAKSPQRDGPRDNRRDNQRGNRKPAAEASVPLDGPREEGTVKWFNRSKGFGFVVRPNGDEIFVHQRSIRSEEGKGRPVLKDGETVSFVVAERERGMQAEDVVPVGSA